VNGNKKKILIVDDEQGFADMVKLNLETTGLFDVAIETDPCNACPAARGFLPDLILLDVIMAGKEGPDVAIDLKESAFLKDIPVVFLTATVTQTEVDKEDGRIGGHTFVAKPSTLEILLEAIENNLMAV